MSGPTAARPLGRAVRQARAHAFVGRGEELALVGAALRGDEAAPSVFYVHGPGGIGKSALLRQVADAARLEGRTVVEVDGRLVEPSTASFEAETASLGDAPRAVLLVDSFEQCGWLETWLRDRFLPRLPDDVVVVLAGRRPPDLEWTVDPGWRHAVRVLALEPLDRDRSEQLLHAHGVDPDAHAAILRFAGGNPLALSLAAAVAATRPTGRTAVWVPSTQVVGSLLARLVGEVPSPAHRRALEAVAQAYATTEDLLAAALPDDDAAALFAWLRGLPFVESGPHGLHPHDAVRETLMADLRWRDPRAFREMQRRLSAHLLRRVRDAPEPDALMRMGALLHVHRDDPSLPLPMSFGADHEVEDEPLGPDDLPVALAMAARHEGQESADLVRYWFARQPEAFRLYRLIDTGEPVAFSARLRLHDAAEARDVAVDPVVAAAWRHAHDTRPPSAGEHIAITRFAVHRELYQELTPAMLLTHWRALVSACRSPTLAHAFLVHEDDDVWRERLEGRTVDTGARPVVGGRSYAVFVHDWRSVPFEPWLASTGGTYDAAAPVRARAPETSPAREEFDEAVRDALLMHRHSRGLAASPLAATLLPAGTADTDEALRGVLRQALASLRTNSRRLRGHDAVVATYLSGATTQQAAARRLQIPFGTYRRHLKQGVQDLTDHLWSLAATRS